MGYLPQAFSLPQLCEHLEQLDYTAAIVGPHGSGKTTLLRELEKHVRQSGIQTEMLFISLDVKLSWRVIRNTIDSMPPQGVLFFDGACHLSFWRFRQLRRRMRKRNIGMVITAHREGLLNTLTVCRSSPALLEDIVSHLLDGNTICSGSYLADLLQTHHGNIRDCLWQLYDEYAGTGNAGVPPAT